MRRMKLWLLIVSVLSADAGVDGGAVDAGLVDAGVAEPAQVVPARWSWVHADGGWLDDAGVTDRVVMRMGETAEVQFPLPIVLMQCDAPLLTLGATLDTLLLTAVQPGRTTCGFWYRPQSWPHRTLDVTVNPRPKD